MNESHHELVMIILTIVLGGIALGIPKKGG